jgi:membrane fusion protein, multidrug efflux system
MTMRRFFLWFTIAGLVALAAGLYFFVLPLGKAQQPPNKSEGKRASRVPVVAVPATTEDIAVYLNALGSVMPLHSVIVKSRIDSQLVKVLFREGQMVKQGDLLAQIDSRPFKVQLAQAEAQMARDKALLQNARLDLERYRALHKLDSVSKQQLDTQEALVTQYEGVVAADQAAIDNAKLQLVYCDITAPVSGRLGLRQVDPGNMVRSSDPNGIVTVTQLAPISVVFNIPEGSLPAVLKKLRAGETLPVEAYDRGGKIKLATRSLLTLDNQIDPTTGTVKLKAQFSNTDYSLFPNQFVNVRMLVDVHRGATVIPGAAVQRGTNGTFVYAVRADNIVNLRPVTLGPAQDGRVAVAEGLQPDELVVVDGGDRLRDGIKVELVSADGTPSKGEASPGGKKKKREMEEQASSGG